MSDTNENVTYQGDLSIVGTFAARAERGGQGGVAPEVTSFVEAVPNGQALLQQFAESYADFRRNDQPGSGTPGGSYMGAFLGDHIGVAREINISAMNAGQSTLGQQAINAVSRQVDMTIGTTPETPAPTTPQKRSQSRLTA